MTTSAKGVQEPQTCAFIGSETESDKDNFWCIGCLENRIQQTILPSTTPPDTIEHSGVYIQSPQWTPESIHAKCHLLTCEVLLNPSPHRETYNKCTQSPSSVRRKQTTYGQIQTGQIVSHGIGGDNIGLIGTLLIQLQRWSTNYEAPS